MNPSLFFAVLRARMGLFTLALCITLATALAVSLMMPKSYRATASLVVDRRDSQSLSEALNVFASPLERAGYLQTQVDILKSPKVAQKVVSTLKLSERPEVRESYAEAGSSNSIDEWLAEQLARNLEVETTQSSVMHLSYSAENPKDAALIANGFAKAFMDTTLELRVEPTKQAAVWFDEQLKTLRTDLETAQERMTDYQQQHGIVSTDERLDEEYARLSELSAQLMRAQEANVELKTREQIAQRSIASGAALDRLPEVQSSSYIQNLRTEMLNGEAALQTLAAKYGDRHPEYLRQRAENRARAEKLETEMRNVVSSATNQRQEGEQRIAEISAAVAAQRSRVLQLKEGRDGLAVLLRNVNTAQTAYDTAMQRFVVNQVESRASQANATLLNAAVIPQRPDRPLLLNLALAAIVGTILGLGLVLTREMSDRRVHSVLELADAINAPVLGDLIPWTPSGQRLLLAAPKDADFGSSNNRQLT